MIEIKNKKFIPFLDSANLKDKIEEMGRKISQDFEGKTPVLVGVLNGAFMFLSDLCKEISIPMEVCFVKISSYQGQHSTGKVRELIGLDVDIEGREIIIVEDIVDTGLSMSHLLKMLKEKNPSGIAIATLLHKPEALQKDIKMDYIGFNIPNKFVVGYGLDYDGVGRNIREIYQLNTD
ncbi:hypoxanthine phosphoribosyltransferase [Arthrospiribacter ruber]|uniref:Hypoxanthine phosphoribosyltransferase n=1 Tax=Arthrospiribacter ruber TaxID=2487934 RepID=A0A951IXU8_9BACT|nr:hypoxanthine phosphoribosyltransferase [Arthrospiribacter ruber]MBW3468778.1 hypoxanthine phosphoribosyltransferase [Arthrospiribacter ruber]